jgi:hypothetical protein
METQYREARIESIPGQVGLREAARTEKDVGGKVRTERKVPTVVKD